jgi:formyltetrahydrofolate deformylase
MNASPDHRHILCYRGPDRPGIAARTAGCLFEHGANVEEAAQYHDRDTGKFFARTLFAVPDAAAAAAFEQAFAPIAADLELNWQIVPQARRARVVIAVSRQDHCLHDLLHRWRSGVLAIDIPAVISNHDDLRELVEWHGIPFHHLPVDPDDRAAQQRAFMAVVEESGAELVVLARYMQILSVEMCRALEGRCINIHHSFLPSFKGARPYHAAHERGVKLIGATAHYVTPDLDEGPIIEQAVSRVNHTHGPSQLVEIGRDIERAVLARAVRWHVERRIQLDGVKTVIFE